MPKGLEMKSSAPLSRPTTRSYSVFLAVSMMTGSFFVPAAARSFCRMVRPSSSGSMMSSRTRSGWAWPMAFQNSAGRSKPLAS